MAPLAFSIVNRYTSPDPRPFNGNVLCVAGRAGVGGAEAGLVQRGDHPGNHWDQGQGAAMRRFRGTVRGPRAETAKNSAIFPEIPWGNPWGKFQWLKDGWEIPERNPWYIESSLQKIEQQIGRLLDFPGPRVITGYTPEISSGATYGAKLVLHTFWSWFISQIGFLLDISGVNGVYNTYDKGAPACTKPGSLALQPHLGRQREINTNQ